VRGGGGGLVKYSTEYGRVPDVGGEVWLKIAIASKCTWEPNTMRLSHDTTTLENGPAIDGDNP